MSREKKTDPTIEQIRRAAARAAGGGGLTYEEVAMLWGCSARTVRRYASNDVIPKKCITQRTVRVPGTVVVAAMSVPLDFGEEDMAYLMAKKRS